MMYNYPWNGGWNMMNAMWSGLGFGPGWAYVFVLLAAWSLIWKGMALWKSARKGQNVWFVVLLVVNTVGVLDILYLYVFSKKFKSVE